MICDKCKAQIPDSAATCPECGSKAGSEAPEFATKLCPRCGAVNPAPAKFCMEDGFNFEEAVKAHKEPEAAADMALKCPLCGTKYPEGIKFCRKDGMPLEPLAAKASPPDGPQDSQATAEGTKPPGNREANVGMDETIRLAPRNFTTRGEAGRIPKERDMRKFPPPAPSRDSATKAESAGIRVKEEFIFQSQPSKEADVPEVQDALKCPLCGTKYPEGIKFCRKDGMPLEPLAAKASQPENPVAPPEGADAAKSPQGGEEKEDEDGTIYIGSLKNSVMSGESEKTAKEQKGREFSLSSEARESSVSMREPAEQVQTKDDFPKETEKSVIGEPAAPFRDRQTFEMPEWQGTQARDTVKCPTCGAMNPEEAEFCRKDGTVLKAPSAPDAGGNTEKTVRDLPLPEAPVHSASGSADSEIRFKEEPAPEAQAAKEAERPEARDTVKCPTCGAMNPEEAEFCRKDGTALKTKSAPDAGGNKEKTAEDLPLPDVPVQSASSEATSEIRLKEDPAPQIQAAKEAEGPEAHYTVKCPTCGTMNPEEARFCRKDGTALKGQAAPAADGSVSAEQKPKKSPARMRASAPVIKTGNPKRSKTGLWITLSVIVLLLACAGGYFYFKGISGMRPGAFQTILNEELKAKGLNVTVEIGKDWMVTLKGSVQQQAEKDLALTTVKLHKEAKNITDNIVFERTPAVIQADIEKGLTERGLTTVQTQVDESFIATLTGMVNNEDEKTAAMDIGRNINGVKEVHDMMTVKVEKQQATPSSAAEAQNSKSKAAKAKAAAAKRDSSKTGAGRLEGEINRALRSAGISSVSAEVKDDMSAVVKGTVPSAGDKQRVMQVVQGFRQIRNVRDIVFVVGQ
jgi:ribosomal protein L40E